MVDVPLRQHLLVEEMTERTVPDVVQQSSQAQRLFDARR